MISLLLNRSRFKYFQPTHISLPSSEIAPDARSEKNHSIHELNCGTSWKASQLAGFFERKFPCWIMNSRDNGFTGWKFRQTIGLSDSVPSETLHWSNGFRECLQFPVNPFRSHLHPFRTPFLNCSSSKLKKKARRVEKALRLSS